MTEIRRIALCTGGGDAPGLNAVLRAAVVSALNRGWECLGIRDGFNGILRPEEYGGQGVLSMGRESVRGITHLGGTILGTTNRGNPLHYPVQGPGGEWTEVDRGDELIQGLKNLGVDGLISVGGDGSLGIAHALAQRGLRVVGVPKTIDNDLAFIGRSFGFETAVYATGTVITAAHTEAKGAHNGIGLVKLMGRDSGFIAAYACLANSVVNMCLIPEFPFELEGEHGVLTALERRFGIGKTHAVIVVAEGAGQNLIQDGDVRKDASGNVLKKDIGEFLKRKIEEHFDSKGQDVTVKYFDPSYSIRSVPAQGTDAILCYMLARGAVHAAMSGRTNCVVGKCADVFMLVPISLATIERQKVDVHDALWQSVVDVTRQGEYMGYEPLVSR